jgi:hypothetical protein
MDSAVVIEPGGGERLGTHIRVKLERPELSVNEVAVGPDFVGAGPHYHEHHVDAFYVLDDDLHRALCDLSGHEIAWSLSQRAKGHLNRVRRLSLPEPADSHVGRMLFHVSAARPQLSVASHADLLTLSFTSPLTETDHIREFARLLSASGVEVTVAAVRVTETELAEREP